MSAGCINFVLSTPPPPLSEANSAPPNPLAGFEGPLCGGKKERGEGKEGTNANAVFSKIGLVASDYSAISLITSKCLPVLLQICTHSILSLTGSS